MFGDPSKNIKKWDTKEFEYFAKIDTKMVNDFKNYSDLYHLGIDNIEKTTGRIINCKKVREIMWKQKNLI
jgi:type I restriction enzyme S subunit